MGQEIHSKFTSNRQGGEWNYRIWSTIVDDYVSDEMTEEDTMEWLLTEALRDVAQKHYSGEPAKRFDRARTMGTSSLLDSRNFNKDWDKPIDHSQSPEED